MNLKLRRTLSSFLAFVMLCSCMVVANAGSVFAATETWSYEDNITTLPSWIVSSDIADGVVTTEAFSSDRGATFVDNIFNNNTSNAVAGQTGITARNFSIITSVDNATVKLYMVRQNEKSTTLQINSDAGEANPSEFTVYGREQKNIEAINITFTNAGTYSFSGGDPGTCLFRAELTQDGSVTPPEEDTYTVSLNAGENGTTAVTVDGVDLVSGTEYAANSDVVVTATPDEGYTAEVKVNDSAVPLTDNSYTFTLSQDTNIVVTYNAVEDPEPPVTGDTVTLVDKIDLSSISTGSVSSGTWAGNFQLVPDPDTANTDSLTVESAENVEVNGDTIDKYVRLNRNDSSIKFTPTEDGTLYVWARGNSSGTTTPGIKLSDSDKTEITQDVNKADGAIARVEFQITANVEYTVSRSAGTGTNIYLLGTTVPCEGSTEPVEPTVGEQVIPDQTEDEESGIITLTYKFSDKTGNLVNVIEERANTSAYATVGNLKKTDGTEETAEEVYKRGDAVNTYVTLSSDGATLYDNSTDYTTRLAIPFIEDAGTTTITGTVTIEEDASTASSWNIIDMGPVALRYDAGTGLYLYDPEAGAQVTGSSSMSCSLTKGTIIDFELAMNLDSHEATAKISVNGGNLTTMTGTVQPDKYGAYEIMDWIVFGTGGSTTNRDITVSDLTITDTNGASIIGINGTAPENGDYKFVENDTENNPVNVALLRRGFNYYIVSVIKNEAVISGEYAEVVQNVLYPLVDGTRQNDGVYNELDRSNEVFEGIEVNGTVYTATDFGGQEGDYLFASRIENDVQETIMNMRNNILQRIATVLTPNAEAAA